MESSVAAHVLLGNLFVVGHNISDPAVSDLFSWPPFFEFRDDLGDFLAFSFASQNQSYLFIFPCLDSNHDFELPIKAERWPVQRSVGCWVLRFVSK